MKTTKDTTGLITQDSVNYHPQKITNHTYCNYCLNNQPSLCLNLIAFYLPYDDNLVEYTLKQITIL